MMARDRRRWTRPSSHDWCLYRAESPKRNRIKVSLSCPFNDIKDMEDGFVRIDDMRIRGNLFYKIEIASKEFEEYSLEFHRGKSKTGKEDHKEMKTKQPRPCQSPVSNTAKLPVAMQNNSSMIRGSDQSKKLRTHTFNQLTGPYDEPFCLDIYISKASVSACFVHQVTSKVVAVAYLISKDTKFDLGSSRNVKPAACVAVGKILAQRALADDIHDVVYTPRKGDKLEGKLLVMLQAVVIDSGVNVKVKLKQRKNSKKEIKFSNKLILSRYYRALHLNLTFR